MDSPDHPRRRSPLSFVFLVITFLSVLMTMNLGATKYRITGTNNELAIKLDEKFKLNSFPIIRMEKQGLEIGSWKSRFDGPVELLDPKTSLIDNRKKMFLKVAVIDLNDAAWGSDPTQEIDIIVDTFRLVGLLVVLPTEHSGAATENRFVKLEFHLLSRKTNIPVHYIQDTPQLRRLLKQQNNQNASSDDSTLTKIKKYIFSDVKYLNINSREPSRHSPSPGTNFEGWLRESASSSSNPILAIVTHHDSFASAAGLATAVDSSGLTVMLELSRILNKVLHQGTRPKYDVLFLATGGAAMDFRGMKQWIIRQDENLLNRIEYVLCLDSLVGSVADQSTGLDFKLHLSKSPKEQHETEFVKLLSDVVEVETGRKLELVTKKIKAYDFLSVPWQHEWLSRQKISSSSFSRARDAVPLTQRISVLDNRLPSSPEGEANILSALNIVARTVTARLFGFSSYSDEAQQFLSNLSSKGIEFASSEGLKSIQQTIHDLPSRAVHMKPWSPRVESIHDNTIKELLSVSLSSVSSSSFQNLPTRHELNQLREEPNNDVATAIQLQLNALQQFAVFYGKDSENFGKDTISVRRTKSSIFDLLVLSCVGLYLFFVSSCFASDTADPNKKDNDNIINLPEKLIASAMSKLSAWVVS